MKENWLGFVNFSPLIALVLVLFLNLTGFCWQKFKYLSYREKVEAIYTPGNKPGFVEVNGKEYKKIPYNSYEEFIKENPNCCEINFSDPSEQAYPEFFNSLTGYHFERVRLSYKIFYEKDGVKQFLTSSGDIGLKSCGEFLRW